MNDLQQFFKNKKILITGHTGFKGGWLSKLLLNWNAQIVGIALQPNTIPNLFNTLKLNKYITNYFVDIRDYPKVKKIVQKEKPEIVFHLAAQPLVRESYSDPLTTFDINILGTANILNSIREIDAVRAVIVITTDKVYKNPESGHPFKENDKLGGYDPYSASKAAAEIIIESYIKSFFNPIDYKQKHNTLIASARAGNVIGGGDWQKNRIIPDIIRAIFERERNIIIRNPNAIRPWQYVLDPLYGYLLLARQLYLGRAQFSGTWNFGPSDKNYITVKDLVKKSLKILWKGKYEIVQDFNKHEAHILKLNSEKAKKLLRWETKIDIQTALKLTLNWYKTYYDNKENIINFSEQQIDYFLKLWH